MNKSENPNWLIILCFAIIYIVWGSTYLANEYGIDAIPPWLMAGTRFTIAGGLLLLFSFIKKHKTPSLKQLKNAWLMGILLMTFGVGGTVWAQQFVDSGITSLIITVNPLVVLLLVLLIEKRKPSLRSIFGVFLGILGMFLLVGQQEIIGGENAIKGILMILFCVFCWALGSVIIPKLDLPKSKIQSSAYQMFLGGFTLFIISLISGEAKGFEISSVPKESFIALTYLIIFGSIIAFTAFNYLLLNVRPEKVATNTYVNPIIAVFLGWFMRDEFISQQTLIAAAIMLTGVYFINSSK